MAAIKRKRLVKRLRRVDPTLTMTCGQCGRQFKFTPEKDVIQTRVDCPYCGFVYERLRANGGDQDSSSD